MLLLREHRRRRAGSNDAGMVDGDCVTDSAHVWFPRFLSDQRAVFKSINVLKAEKMKAAQLVQFDRLVRPMLMFLDFRGRYYSCKDRLSALCKSPGCSMSAS